MTATEWTNQHSDEVMYQVPGSRLRELRQAVDDLAACRARLAALVAAWEQKASLIGDMDAARDWLAQQPEGGQDG